MAKHNTRNPSKSATPAKPTSATPATAKALASASHAVTAVADVPTPGATPPAMRTLPGNVLRALVSAGATVAWQATNPKRVGTKAAAAWPTMARAATVAEACQGPLGAADVAYSLAHGQCVATVAGKGSVGQLGKPLTVAQLAEARAMLGLA